MLHNNGAIRRDRDTGFRQGIHECRSRINLVLLGGQRIKEQTRLLMQDERLAIRILVTRQTQGGCDGSRVADGLINDQIRNGANRRINNTVGMNPSIVLRVRSLGVIAAVLDLKQTGGIRIEIQAGASGLADVAGINQASKRLISRARENPVWRSRNQLVVAAIDMAQAQGKIRRIDKGCSRDRRGASGHLCDDVEQVLTGGFALGNLDVLKNPL